MGKLEEIDDLQGRQCPTCGAVLRADAGRYDVRGRTDPVYLQGSGTLRCPNGHGLPPEYLGK